MTTTVYDDKICIMLKRFFNNKFDFQLFELKIEKSIIKVCLLKDLRLYYFVQALNKAFYKSECKFELSVGTKI
jgi:hypothetical protein